MSTLPFTDALHAGREAWLKDHPEAANEPVPPVIQLIVDTEAATARDFAEGKITADEFAGFQARSQEQLDGFVGTMKDAGHEMADIFESWASDTKDSIAALKDEHKDAIEDVMGGHDRISVAHAADLADGFVTVIEGAPDAMFDAVDVAIDGIDNGLAGAAAGVVEARNALPSVDDAERDANHARLDAAVAEMHDVLGGVHDGIDVARDTIHDDLGRAHDAIDAMHDYGVDHPDATVHTGQIIEAQDVTEHLHEEQVDA